MWLLWLLEELCARCFMLARVPVPAAATAAADRAAEAEGCKIAVVAADGNALTVQAVEDDLAIPSSSITDRLELALKVDPSVCCDCF